MQGTAMVNSAPVMGGMNQMMEIFKMQILMKYLDSPSKGGSGSIVTIFVLMMYDYLMKFMPQFVNAFTQWLQDKVKKPTELDKKHDILMPLAQPPPPTKQIRAYIQFERPTDGKVTDPRIDAVIYHVCNLSDVRSLRYNGVEMIPNFKDMLMIENDVWFEIISSTNTASPIHIEGGGGMKQEAIYYRLSTYDHDITWLHRFVEQAIERFEQEKRNKLGSETYYFDMLTNTGPYGRKIPGSLCIFNKSKFTSNRTLGNVYLRQIDELSNRVEFFMRRRDWYDSKGIPHTLGIVMYGVPGCGKTSTIKAIANETKRHIFNIMLSEIKTKEALKDLFYNEQVNVLTENKMEVLNIPLKQRLYVIEDIDAMNSVVIKRSAEQIKEDEERKIRIEADMELLRQTQGDVLARNMVQGKQDEDTNKLDLATLLNVLDGVRETPGRIIILSTNYPERLDEALLRPGRFDMMLEFEKHSCSVLQQHIEKYYDITLTEEQKNRIYCKELDKKWTPAEVGQILFRRIHDVDGAIDDLINEDPKELFKFSQMNANDDKDNDKDKDKDNRNILTPTELQPQPPPQHLQEDVSEKEMAEEDAVNEEGKSEGTDLSSLLMMDNNRDMRNLIVPLVLLPTVGAIKREVTEPADAEDTTLLVPVKVEATGEQAQQREQTDKTMYPVKKTPYEEYVKKYADPYDRYDAYTRQGDDIHESEEAKAMCNEMLKSSLLFENAMGFTAMNDLGLPTEPAETDSMTLAANAAADIPLDDYYKEELIREGVDY